MADQNNSNSSPAANANAALGGAMMGEIAPFDSDQTLPDHSDDIASIFGLGEEAGPEPNSPQGGPEGGASPSGATSAADGREGQAQPATPPVAEPQAPQPGQQGNQPQAPAPAPQPAAVPPAAPVEGQPQAPSGDPAFLALQAQVQALVQHNAQLQQQLAQGAGNQAPQYGTAPQQQQDPLLADNNPLLDYRLAMPEDVAAAVFNEDPAVARQGLTHVMNALARTTHQRVLQHVDQLVNARLSQYGEQQQLTSQQEQMRQQYYAAFPQHNDPATKLIVMQEAQQLWTLNPTMQWDQNAMNTLGARVQARLGQAPFQPQAQQPAIPPLAQPQQQQAQPAPRPAAQMGASNRPPANPGDNDGNFIHDILTA